MNTGEGLAEAAARAEGAEPQHDTAIYWFSCTHKRQVGTGRRLRLIDGRLLG